MKATLDIADTDLWRWIQGYLEATSMLSPVPKCKEHTGRAAQLLCEALDNAEREARDEQ